MADLMAAAIKPSVLRTAMVTGAARGIGLATAQALLAAGHRVAWVDKERTPCARGNQAALDRVLALVQDLVDPDGRRKSR